MKVKIIYELNPPKIITNNQVDYVTIGHNLHKLVLHASELVNLADGIHITDSVLGVPRLSSIYVASILRKSGITLPISCSIRVSDRNLITLYQSISEAALSKIYSVLLLMGDKPAEGSSVSNLTPSYLLKQLNLMGFAENIKLDLSSPNNINNLKIFNEKLKAKPRALMTQSIRSIADLSEIISLTKKYGIDVIPCVMCPSEKNQISARKIGLNWNSYKDDPVEFIRSVAKLTNKFVLCSPGSFRDGLNLVDKIREA